MGRENSEEFYTELVEAARKNKRNSKEYVDYIREPIILDFQAARLSTP